MNPVESKPNISYDDFAKLDVRAGTIISATAPEWSKKLLRFEVNFGEELGSRIIFSGIREWYQPEFFPGKQFIFIVNLAPKKMGDEFSQGMMMMADSEEKPTVQPLSFPVADGTVIR